MKTDVIYIIILMISFIVEIIAGILLGRGYPSYDSTFITIIILTHLLASFLAAWGVALAYGERKKIAYFIFVFVLTLPFFGYIGVLQAISARKTKTATFLYKEYRQHIMTGAESTRALPPLKNSYDFLRRNIDVESIYDTIQDNVEVTRKLDVIRSLGRIKNRESIQALKILLSDSHMDVRYYAGEEISLIAEQYNIFINQLKKEIINNPDDYKLYLELGNLIVDYAFSGFFDSQEIKEELQEAKLALKNSLSIEENQYEANFLMAYIYLFNKEYGKAIDYYRKALLIEETFRHGVEHLPTLLGLAECYWQKKDLFQTDAYINRMKKVMDYYKGEDKELIKEFISNWGGYNAD